MQVRLLVSRATASGPQNIGDVLEVPEAEAVRMVAAGQAEAVRAKKPQRATAKVKPEKAVK